MNKLDLKIKRLPHSENIILPSYRTTESAGFDLHAAVPKDQPIILAPMQRVLVPTGFIFEIPYGFEGQIRPRSGLALKNGITVLNSPGTIDSDYRGEVQILIINLGTEEFCIMRNMRIAQMIISPVQHFNFQEVNELATSLRADGGFGSTGV